MRQRRIKLLLVALICARVVAGCAAANQPPPGSPSAAASTAASTSSSAAPQKSAPLDLCRTPDLAPARALSTPGYAQLAVSVTGPDGTPISGLKQSDFTVRSGSNSLPIVYFRQDSNLTTPLSLVIVSDVSASMYQKTVVVSGDELKLTKARAGLNEAAGKLSECDEIAVVLIGGKYERYPRTPLGPVTLALPFTTSHSRALDQMYSVTPSGEKRLAEGIQLGLETLSGAHYPNRAMVLITDGLDPAAIDRSAPVLARVRDSGIAFRVIGIGDPDAQDGLVAKMRGSSRLDVAAVKKLATDGGGVALTAKPVDADEGVSLAAAVTTINEHLGQGYAIGIAGSPGSTEPAVTLANNSGAMVRAELVPPGVLAAAAALPAGKKREIGTATDVMAPQNISNLPGYTEIAATVANPDGKYVNGLSKGDFHLSVDGRPQPIDFFRAEDQSPATVGILVDTSGSMAQKLPQARAAIEEFVKTLGPQDDVFLFAFSNKPFRLQPLTDDHNALIQRLSLLHAYGQTALFDVIIQGIAEAELGHNGRKVLLVITDGMDNTSSSSADDVVQAAKSSGVLVYSIGIGNPDLPGGQSIALGPFVVGGNDVERVDAATLSRLASANGGKSYIIQEVGDGAALKKACGEIADDLHAKNSYAIGFVAQAPANYAPTTMPIALQVPAHNDYLVDAPKWIPAPPSPN